MCHSKTTGLEFRKHKVWTNTTEDVESSEISDEEVYVHQQKYKQGSHLSSIN